MTKAYQRPIAPWMVHTKWMQSMVVTYVAHILCVCNMYAKYLYKLEYINKLNMLNMYYCIISPWNRCTWSKTLFFSTKYVFDPIHRIGLSRAKLSWFLTTKEQTTINHLNWHPRFDKTNIAENSLKAPNEHHILLKSSPKVWKFVVHTKRVDIVSENQIQSHNLEIFNFFKKKLV